MDSDKKITFSYSGIAFRQNSDAPELFAFVASSNELVKFCGVARKSERMLTNYQRALDDVRVKNEITPFFKIPQNSSPTAIVLSLHESPISKIEFHDPSGNEREAINLKTMTITMPDIDGLSMDEVIDASISFLDDRLKSSGVGIESLEGTEDTDLEVDDEAGEPTGDPDIDEEDEGDEEIELGKSMLQDLRNKLAAREDISSDLLAALRDMLRPALVIDGQHRLFGAAAVEENIPMLVCSLVKPDWKEQVFRFTVINDKARGIPKPFITSLAGMSLTAQELSDLQNRLAQAGVQLWEVDVMQRLGYDPHSAFFKKIEFKVSGSGSKDLGYQTMKRVGKAWYDPKSHGLSSLLRALYIAPGQKKLNWKVLKTKWQKNEDWFHFFCLFWKSFKEKFGNSDLWDTHSNLMIAVVLEQIQEVFLSYLSSVTSLTIDRIKESDEDKRRAALESEFMKIVQEFASKFEEKHFSKSWAKKSLNHKEGKLEIKIILRKFTKVNQSTITR